MQISLVSNAWANQMSVKIGTRSCVRATGWAYSLYSEFQGRHINIIGIIHVIMYTYMCIIHLSLFCLFKYCLFLANHVCTLFHSCETNKDFLVLLCEVLFICFSTCTLFSCISVLFCKVYLLNYIFKSIQILPDCILLQSSRLWYTMLPQYFFILLFPKTHTSSKFSVHDCYLNLTGIDLDWVYHVGFV